MPARGWLTGRTPDDDVLLQYMDQDGANHSVAFTDDQWLAIIAKVAKELSWKRTLSDD